MRLNDVARELDGLIERRAMAALAARVERLPDHIDAARLREREHRPLASGHLSAELIADRVGCAQIDRSSGGTITRNRDGRERFEDTRAPPSVAQAAMV